MRIPLQEALYMKEKLIHWIQESKLFMYPTDTVYGLGCDATNTSAVQRIRELKKTDQPFSVIAPSKQWILNHVDIDAYFLNRLPGPVTFIARKKTPFLESAAPGETLGIRIPDHPLTPLIQESQRPFVTTSCNRSGEQPPCSVDDSNPHFLEKIDVIIDGGVLDNPPSTLLNVTKGRETVQKR